MSTQAKTKTKYGVPIQWLTALAVLFSLVAAGPADAQTARWWTEFFSNTTLSGSPIHTRADSAVNFDWGSGAPAAGVPADDFSARFTRTEWFDSGTYRFYARSDDGFRLWVGAMLVIDSWQDQQGGWLTRDVYLVSGTYQVKAEYYENAGAAYVQLNWERIGGGQGWQAEYFTNPSLSGTPAVRRTDTAIDFAWGAGSPAATIPADQFSARWTQTLGFTAGTYRFFTSTDDGVRLWVDNVLLVDKWILQGLPNTHTGDRYLTEGLHTIKVEYFESGGQAHAHVWWQRLDGSTPPSTPTPPTGAWRGEYFNNKEMSGGPTLVRDDAEINFDWGTGAPISWMAGDNFSARWTRQMSFSAGYYRLSVQSDDGVRVWLDNGLVIDKWQVMNNELHYVDGIYLSGLRQLKIEYFEQNGYARIKFWISPSGSGGQPANPPPTTAGSIVVDNGSANLVKGGAASGWHTANAGHGGSLIWTRNNDYARRNYNWVRWYPYVSTPGRYEVFVYIPDQYATTTNARYWVRHANGYALMPVNQSTNVGRWVSLGTYQFNGRSTEYVSLADITYESYLSRNIAFDAMMWVPR